MEKAKLQLIIASLTLLLLIVSCAPIPSCEIFGLFDNGAGLIAGIWHGFILPFSVLGKALSFDIGLYNGQNEGFTYWAGFLVGINLFFFIAYLLVWLLAETGSQSK